MKNTKNKKRKIGFSAGTVLVLFFSAIPFLLLVLWLKVLVGQVQIRFNSFPQFGMAKDYQSCEENNEVIDPADFNQISQGLTPQQIKIESVGIDLPIIAVSLEEGTWQVNDNVANYAQGTALINMDNGNIGIYGHDRENVFSQIKKLAVGDKIILFSDNFKATYIITDSFVSEKEDVDVFFETEEPVLTLVTCDGVLSEKRYIVKAKFDTMQKIMCYENNL